MTDQAMTAALQDILDRQAIWQCLLRYCRGVDRHDRDLLRSVYHDDATEDHGMFVGSCHDFIEWAIGFAEELYTAQHHSLSNHSCEIDGNVAHCETYMLFYAATRQGAHSLAMGRYIDRFERRDGRWAIAARVCVTEAIGDLTRSEMPPELAAQVFSGGPSTRDRSDVSYQRPLVPRRAGQARA